MTNDQFKVYVDRLREEHIAKIDESFSPEFLDIKEDGLAFLDPVKVQGEAYLTSQELILKFKAETLATLSCSICNEPVKVPLQTEDAYLAIPFEETKSGIYDYSAALREAILLETPLFAECDDGHCPKRQEFAKFFRESSDGDDMPPDEHEGHHPFANLKLE